MNARPFLIPLIILGAAIMGIFPANAEKTGGYMAVEAGHGYVLVLKHDGSLWGGGSNFAGQLGDGTRVDRLSPVKIADSVKDVAAGDHCTIYITENGELMIMGDIRE